MDEGAPSSGQPKRTGSRPGTDYVAVVGTTVGSDCRPRGRVRGDWGSWSCDGFAEEKGPAAEGVGEACCLCSLSVTPEHKTCR